MVKEEEIEEIIHKLTLASKNIHKNENNIQYSRLLEEVLKGITDIIGVYRPDNTIMFYNEAGYDFYKKSHDEIKGKKCYEMLGRKEKCFNCTVEQAVKSKKIIRTEKYIPELQKYMDCCCNPVFGDSGEILFIVEQLRDITEKKKMENIQRESEEGYRKIVNLSPDAIIIISEEKIVLANKEAQKYFDNLIGKEIYQYIPSKYVKVFKKRTEQILKNKIKKTIFDYKIKPNNKKVTDLEASSSYITYNGKPAIISILRNITDMKKRLNAAAKIQKQILKKQLPLPSKVKIETLYIPAKTVSGDYFSYHKVNEDFIIGIIGDVSGKGITAALDISAFNVLFNEAVLASHNPLDVLNKLNEKIGNYLGERYIAACCFSFDFSKNEARIVGAGINQFIVHDIQGKCEERIVKGPFLGMFEESVFDEQIIHFQSGDKFYFFTDGLEFIFEGEKIKYKNIKKATITEVKNYLSNYLNDKLTDIEGIKDDCTLIAAEIK